MVRATLGEDTAATTFSPPRSLVRAVVVAIRPRQCLTKNLLVFAAPVFALRIAMPATFFATLAAFVLFCALSGAVYLVNDMLDVEQDRLHPRKRLRPIAAGDLPMRWAIAVAATLLTVALVGAALVRPALAVVLAVYFAVQLSYSLGLKHQVILDVFIIAAGFVLRAAAGAVAINVPISAWLYVCTVLLALFLGFGKRRAELRLLGTGAGAHRPVLGEYSLSLLDQMTGVVTASTVVAYSLYTFSASNLPGNHAMMLTIPFVVYGIFRYMYLIEQKDGGGSPEKLLLTDMPLLACIALWGLACMVILYLPR